MLKFLVYKNFKRIELLVIYFLGGAPYFSLYMRFMIFPRVLVPFLKTPGLNPASSRAGPMTLAHFMSSGLRRAAAAFNSDGISVLL